MTDFVFASELKSFLFLPGFTAREDPEVMTQALADPAAFELTESSLLVGVRRLPRGHNLLVGADGPRVVRWWRTLDHLPEVPAGFADQAEGSRSSFSTRVGFDCAATCRWELA